MKVPVYGLKGAEKGSITVARAFTRPVRSDLIKRAVMAEQAAARQPYGADPMAGKRTSAHYHGRRGSFNAMMNREMARMKRIHSSGHLHMRARFVPQAVKGMKVHAPKAEKIWTVKVNKKEKRAALLSAASATFSRKWLEDRGYVLEGVRHVPLVVDDKLQEVSTIKDFMQVMDNLGLREEVARLAGRKIRAGKATMRGRRYKKRRGMLMIITEDKGLVRATRNLEGMEVCEVADITVSSLAPGTVPGRLCIWTEGAVKAMEELA